MALKAVGCIPKVITEVKMPVIRLGIAFFDAITNPEIRGAADIKRPKNMPSLQFCILIICDN